MWPVVWFRAVDGEADDDDDDADDEDDDDDDAADEVGDEAAIKDDVAEAASTPAKGNESMEDSEVKALVCF